MRLVLDTNVVASAILWSGAPRTLLDAARRKQVELFTSAALLVELADILARRKFERKIAAAGLSVDEIVSLYAVLATPVRPESTPPVAPDPDDDVVIGTAITARADLLVTGDKPFLTVVAYGGVRIVTVVTALQIISVERS